MLHAGVTDGPEQRGGGEPAQQEHLADAGHCVRQGVRLGEVARRHVHPFREGRSARAPRDGADGLVPGGERVDELVADVAGGSGDKDHDGPSKVSTRVSPPVTSSTAPVTCGLVIRNTAAWAMSSGVPIRFTGIACATRRRSSSRSPSGRNDHMSLSV